MNYEIEFKPRALKDLKGLPRAESSRIVVKAEALQNDLAGDVKRLTNFTLSTGCASVITGFCLKWRGQRW